MNAPTNYAVSSIPYAPDPFTTGTNVALFDDQWSAAINIGFPFCFYGNTYTQVLIGSNGLISFNVALAGGYCQWPINAAVPSAADPMNTVMGPWQDLYPPGGGTIRYTIYGTAPCRRFVVSWNQMPMYSCTSTLCTQQITLYETSNVIDNYIQTKPLCTGWNAGTAIQAVHNAAGTAAVAVAGRNYPTQWTTTNDARRWTPSGANMTSIGWYIGAALQSTAQNYTPCPTATTTYNFTATYTNCNGTTVQQTDQVVVTVSSLTVTATQTNLTCFNNCTGSSTVTASGGGPYSYNWSPAPGGGQGTATATGLCAQSYTCVVTGAGGCTGQVVVNITQPPQIALVPTQTNVLCNGVCNGAASVVASGGTGVYTYVWAPAPGGGQGTANATGLCAGTYTVTVSSPAGCTRTQAFTITQPPALASTGSHTNILCNGACTGAASVTPSGGVGPYTYSWAPSGGTASSTTGRCVGTYTVTFTDANGCTGTRVFNITQPTAVTTTGGQTNVTCNGACTGSATVTPSGGVGPYTYVWSPAPGGGQGTAIATGLCANTYTVTVTDANGCTATRIYTITQPPVIALVPTQTNVLCNGQCNGAASVVASGGTGTYTYVWAPAPGAGQGTANATGLCAGNYTVTVSSPAGCTRTQIFNITAPPALTSTGSHTNILCNGACTGAATVTPSGGVGPYTYSWAPSGGTAATTTGRCAGTYTVTFTDANGCTGTRTFNITAPPALTSTGSQTNILCNGACTGAASVTPSGGVGPYTYSWAPSGGTASSTTGRCVGTYTVTFTDANGCTGTRIYNITQPPALTSTTSFTQATCNMSNGLASVTPSGGVGPYTYLWAPSGGTGATTTPRPAGIYTVTFTDANGCTGTATVNIPNAAAPTATITAVVNVTCFGASTGSATVAASGGTGPYTYAWTPSGGTGTTTTPRPAGNYTVTVTDANGCTVQQTVAITQPPAITLTPTQTNVLCNGGLTGSASVVASGGTGTFTYAWAPSGGTGATATGLGAGTYTVTVSSPAGCTATQTYTITAPPALTSTGTQTNILCNAACTGAASVTVTGGVGPYTYLWAPSGGTAAGTTGRCVGTYTVTFTDANGCTGTRSFTITQPTALAATTSFTQATCNMSNGSASVSVSGGVGPYTYLWAPLGGTTATVTGRPAGTYTVTYTDANGCTGTATVTIPNAAAPTATITATVNVTCFGASTGGATVAASGGTGPYTYAWTPSGGTGSSTTGRPAGTYTVTVTDANGCTVQATVTITQPPAITLTPTQTNVLCNGGLTGSASVVASGGTGTYTYAWAPSGGTGATATGLGAGTYTVTVSSPAGCTATQIFNITAPPVLTTTGAQTNVLCNGGTTGSATVTPSGGVGPYTYSWAPTGGTAAIATGLTAQTYTVTVTDANGCTATRTFTITQPPALTSTTSFTQATCNMSNGSASVAVSGGVGPYTYSWAPTGGTGATASGQPSGIYTVTFTDANGCTGTATVNIPNAAAPSATITATTPVVCFGGNTGSATVAASGGTGPYTYAWAPIGGTGTTGTNLTAQTYTVTVTDVNGCTATATTTITQPTAVTATAASSPVLCNGGSTGSATVTPAGGIGPYTYAWAPSGGTAATATGLNATTYTVTVTDANGCTTTAMTTVTQPTAVTATAASSPVLCNGGTTGSATVTPVGGTGPYTFAWAPTGGTAAIATGLNANTYTVTVTDANGCTITAITTVTQPPALSATTSFTQATCGASNGSASVAVTGGVGPYTYAWAPAGGTGATATGLAANTYTVTFTDANGCTGTASVTVPNAASPSATITATTNVSCFGGNNGSATVAASGGTGPYTYAWTPIGGTGTVGTNLTAQIYTVTVTDANGCSTTATATITEPPLLTATATSSPVLCFGGTTGSATVTASGGVAPYTYAWSPTGGTATTATGLNATTYTVTVTDANGCTTTAMTTVTEPTAVTATAVMTPVLCNGGNTGTATATPGGGVGPYTYSWSPSGQTTATATNLTAQSYTVTVTDANGCTVTASVTVTEPPALAATTSFTQATCGATNGSASVNVTGGVGPYTYSWSPSGGTGSTATGLGANVYTVTFTDANGCTGTATVNVPNAAAPSITITGTTAVTCFGGNDGTASTSASGGTAPYTYSWALTGGTGATGIGMIAGNYTVTVTDANGCTATATTTITEPTQVTATSSTTDVICNGNATGTATAVGAGGIAPYTYLWSSGGTNALETGLLAGSYTCTVTDANGCTTTTIATVVEPTQVTSTISGVDILCNGGNNGSATVIPAGGIGPYTYLWTPTAQTTATASTLTAGTYSCDITDANGCSITVTITLTEPAALTATTSFTQATCGAANGSAVVTVNGGISPYTYLWSSGGTAALETGLAANTYTVTFTDANGCSDTAQVTVPNAASPVITVTGTTPVTCFGGNDGTASTNTTGGTAPYTYAWALTGGTGATGTGMVAGNYTVTVTDANGCTSTATTTITEPTLVTATSTTTDVICNGNATGTATAVGAGGIAPYTYLWSSGGTNALETGLLAGSYTCTVTDANGCTTTTIATVVEPTQVTSTISGVDILCNGGNNGSATVVPAGGIGPYTYLWTPTAQTTATATTLLAGTYSCDITDANGCSITVTITLTEPAALTATTSFTQATCSQANGSADVTVSGGIGPYTYSWSSGGTAALETGLAANTYTVTFTDANGCSDTAQVTVPNAASPAIVVSGTTAVTCFGGADGTATTVTTGGTAPYTYAWALTGGTGSVGTGMIAGNYTVTVTDANGCTATATTTITEPTLVTATSSTTDVICNGDATGTATAVGAGGIAPYTYLWSSGGTNALETGLAAGSYTCTVTDANGCTTTTSVTVVEPTQVTSTISGVDILCFGGNNGSATVTPAGGIGPYTYLWSPSAQTTATATTLTAQTYSCDITDANGCSITLTITLTEPPALAATTSFTQSTCSQANGSADVTVTGGTGPGTYTYVWAPSGGTAALETNLAAGTYTVTFTDANGCIDTAQVTVPNAASPAIVVSGTTAVTCFGGADGTATTVTTGGTAPYTYAWALTGGTGSVGTGMIAGNYTVTVTDANGCTATATTIITEPTLVTATSSTTDVICNAGATGTATAVGAGGIGPYTYSWSTVPVQTTATATALLAGSYTCTVTDANGCSTTTSVTVVEPTQVTSTISGVDILCFGGNNGSATVTPAGGIGPYTYMWSPSAQTTQTATTLTAQTYSCDITDANGCSITITITLTEPPALSAVTSFTQSTCGASNGTADVVVSGGAGPYTYLWNPSGGTSSTEPNIPAGPYTVLITDSNMCTLTASVTVPSAPGPVAVIAPPSNVLCFGGNTGSALASVSSGGTGPFSYVWSNNDLDSLAGNLIAGNYSVVITDANGCTSSASVLITEPPLLTVQANANPNTICAGTVVALSSNAGGGVPAYTFDWTPGPLSGANQNVTPMVSTTFVVTVTDANGCTTTQNVPVTVNPLPVAVVGADVTQGCAPVCVNFADLSTIASGTITSWAWDFGDGNTSNVQNPPLHCYDSAGVYTVTLFVTSSDGCSQTIVMNNYITVFANPVAAFGAGPLPTTILNPEIFFTDSSTLAAEWNWNFGDFLNSASTDQNPSFTYNEADCYLVTLEVTSSDGCVDTATQEICIGPDVSIYVPNTFTPNGNGLNDVFIPITIGIDPEQYELWIFDRWGNMIFYTNDLDEGWDGRVQGMTEIVQQDTYVWKIVAKDLVGNQHNLIGHINVIK